MRYDFQNEKPEKRKSTEGYPLVAHEVDCTVHKKSKELSKILITPANFDKKQKKQELRCIRYRKSTGKKQDFMPDGILFPVSIKRENPELTPYKVMNLRHYISHYIGYHVMFTLYMHEQSYNQCSYQGVQCTYYGKT